MYERGVSSFGWPHVTPLWQTYLDKFVKRCVGRRLGCGWGSGGGGWVWLVGYTCNVMLWALTYPGASPLSQQRNVRYGGDKLERARDLFEQCLAKCPPAISPEFFIKVRGREGG